MSSSRQPRASLYPAITILSHYRTSVVSSVYSEIHARPRTLREYRRTRPTSPLVAALAPLEIHAPMPRDRGYATIRSPLHRSHCHCTRVDSGLSVCTSAVSPYVRVYSYYTLYIADPPTRLCPTLCLERPTCHRYIIHSLRSTRPLELLATVPGTAMRPLLHSNTT
jgi:hypothetical protein